MTQIIKELYFLETDQARLDFDHDPIYRTYLTQAEEIWKEHDMPKSIFHLLERSNFLSFSHGFQLGMGMTLWGLGAFRRLGGE